MGLPPSLMAWRGRDGLYKIKTMLPCEAWRGPYCLNNPTAVGWYITGL